MKAIRLRTEYLNNPIGVDLKHPRLMWNVEGGVDPYMKPMDGSAGWSDAGVLIPWVIYSQYGDARILAENYDSMRQYALYKIGTVGKWYPTSVPTGVGLSSRRRIANYGQSYGEWAEPADVKAFSVSDFISPHPEETTAFIVYLMRHMEKIARRLDKPADAALFHDSAEQVRRGYQALVRTRKYNLDTDRQAKLVRPLYMDLLDEGQNAFLNRLTEEATGKKVIALPIEATAIGNLHIQMEVKL